MRHSCTMSRGGELLTITYHGRVFFECKSATLKPGGLAELRLVANVVNLFPVTAIHVEVRLDACGFQANSHDLQRARVLAVKDALLEQGLDAGDVQTTVCPSQRLSSEDTVSVRVIDRLMGPPFRQAQAGYQNGSRYDHQAC